MKSHRIAILILLTFLAFSLNAQIYILHSPKEIKKIFKNTELDSTQIISIKESMDSIPYIQIGIKAKDSVEAIYFFDEFDYCNEIIIKYTCGECFQKFKEELLSDKIMNWTEFENNRYISSKLYRSILEVEFIKDSIFCVEVKVKRITKKEYKKISKIIANK